MKIDLTIEELKKTVSGLSLYYEEATDHLKEIEGGNVVTDIDVLSMRSRVDGARKLYNRLLDLLNDFDKLPF